MHLRWVKLGVCLAALGALLSWPLWDAARGDGPDAEPRSNCLALLVFASMLWSLEVGQRGGGKCW